MVKSSQTIRRQFADELFECVWPFCDIDASMESLEEKKVFREWFMF